jgi:hypothetical protein
LPDRPSKVLRPKGLQLSRPPDPHRP